MRRHRRCRSDDVVDLYRLLLGRDPESEKVIRSNVGRPWRDLIAEILRSEEFRKTTDWDVVDHALTQAMDFRPTTSATPDELERRFRRVQTYWQDVGADERTAYWSVLTAEQWSGRLGPQQLRAFYETGKENVDLLVGLAQHARPDFAIEQARVLDYGCGVGRLLLHLARSAMVCEGWDFSPTHLKHLKENFTTLFGLSPDSYGLRRIDELHFAQPQPGFDLIVSVLTLQHNPTTLMAHAIRQLLQSLAHGGVAVLHIPTAALDDRDEHQEPDAPAMEMNAIPKDAIFDIAADEGATVRSSRYVNWTGPVLLGELVVIIRD